MRRKNEARRQTPRRCAWCRRFCVDGKWIRGRRAEDRSAISPAHVTHTICDDCVAKLRRSGLSR